MMTSISGAETNRFKTPAQNSVLTGSIPTKFNAIPGYHSAGRRWAYRPSVKGRAMQGTANPKRLAWELCVGFCFRLRLPFLLRLLPSLRLLES